MMIAAVLISSILSLFFLIPISYLLADQKCSKSGIEVLSPLYLDTTVNYIDLTQTYLYFVSRNKKDLYISKEAWDFFDLNTNYSPATCKVINHKQYYLISNIDMIKYTINYSTLKVNFSISAKLFKKNVINLAHKAKNQVENQYNKPGYSSFINYNITTFKQLTGSHQTYINNNYTTLGLLTPIGSFTQSLLWLSKSH